ncbi:uncharacterized protein LOC124121483 [Haliotis rufescens]|uniref:uncharacterized protein LOC124121483 n=1 Tax=Haliotis rufescens TaxID=6454 RepID=UPI001EB00DC7|nr:uncharacterized protein LOC124121483 [Haliotis rufescens]
MAGVFESLKGAGAIGIVVLVLALVGNICNWIAFTTAAWAREFPDTNKETFTGYGLWRICGTGTDTGFGKVVSGCTQIDGTNLAYYGAVQALVSIGFLGLNAMCLIIILKIFTSKCADVSDIDKVNGIQAIVTGVLYLIGIIIFGAEYGNGDKLRNVVGTTTVDGDLGYSFVFAVFAMLLEIVVGVVLLVTSLKGGSVAAK